MKELTRILWSISVMISVLNICIGVTHVNIFLIVSSIAFGTLGLVNLVKSKK